MVPGLMDIYRVLPEFVWCAAGVILMLLQPFLKNRPMLTFLAMAGAAIGTLSTFFGIPGSGFSGLIQFDTYSLYFHWLVGLITFLVLLASDSYLARAKLEGGGV